MNPSFVVLQYRLGIGLGYRAIQGNCQPTGDWIRVLKGDRWIREWPRHPTEQWFFHWHGQRVLQCGYGWYLVDPDDQAFRTWWLAQVAGQIAATHADGAFLDSVSVPNYFGGSSWKPPLPDVSSRFESMWAGKIERWLPAAQAGLGVPVIANAGEWITTRDPTDYSGAAGIMIEGCAEPSSGNPLAPGDWVLQMDRVLGEVNAGKVVICQSYPDTGDVPMRMFVLGSYLLFKGSQQYVNLEISMSPEWFPEYGIDLGPAVDPVPADISVLLDHGAYVRHFQRGRVVVNPGDSVVTYALGGTMYEVTPVGGGVMPDSGIVPPGWTLTSTAVTSVTLGPHRAAVLLSSPADPLGLRTAPTRASGGVTHSWACRSSPTSSISVGSSATTPRGRPSPRSGPTPRSSGTRPPTRSAGLCGAGGSRTPTGTANG